VSAAAVLLLQFNRHWILLMLLLCMLPGGSAVVFTDALGSVAELTACL